MGLMCVTREMRGRVGAWVYGADDVWACGCLDFAGVRN